MISRVPYPQALILCSAAVLLAGCSQVSSPKTVSGVWDMYRSIGVDDSSGNFTDICDSYMDEPLRATVERTNHDCTTSSTLSTLERWAEKVRLSKIKPQTKIIVSGGEALVYDGTMPERVLYRAGQWRLTDVPELSAPRQTG